MSVAEFKMDVPKYLDNIFKKEFNRIEGYLIEIINIFKNYVTF